VGRPFWNGRFRCMLWRFCIALGRRFRVVFLGISAPGGGGECLIAEFFSWSDVTPIPTRPCSPSGGIALQRSVATPDANVERHGGCIGPRSLQYAATIETQPTESRKSQHLTQRRPVPERSGRASRVLKRSLSLRSNGDPVPSSRGAAVFECGNPRFWTRVNSNPMSVVPKKK
jgi:hypothetical protein